jgi:acetyltransferase-like isoleucine patch superfamily enzyme
MKAQFSYLRLKLRAVRNLLVRFTYSASGVSCSSYLPLRGSISKDLSLGKYSYIGPNAYIPPLVTIGDYFMCGSDLLIVGGDHVFDDYKQPMIFSGRGEQLPTTIGDDVWIGARVIIMRGVSIGSGVVVSAGSVVLSDIPDNSIYAGVPAVFKRERVPDLDKSSYSKMLNSFKGGKFCDPL